MHMKKRRDTGKKQLISYLIIFCMPKVKALIKLTFMVNLRIQRGGGGGGGGQHFDH